MEDRITDFAVLQKMTDGKMNLILLPPKTLDKIEVEGGRGKLTLKTDAVIARTLRENSNLVTITYVLDRTQFEDVKIDMQMASLKD